MIPPALSPVQQWHSALNAGQVDQMMTFVHPQVEIGGPRGVTSGAEIVREWFGRANVRLLPQRWFAREGRVVVEELGEWLSPETGEITGSQLVASAFSVRANLITRIVRHETLAEALADADLTVADEVALD
jgi:hypothetical protein